MTHDTVNPNILGSPVIVEDSAGDCMGITSTTHLAPILTEPIGSCSVFYVSNVAGGIELMAGSYAIGESGGLFKLETPSTSGATTFVVVNQYTVGGHNYNNLYLLSNGDYACPAGYGQDLLVGVSGGLRCAWRWPAS
jgi:hypothetical protein